MREKFPKKKFNCFGKKPSTTIPNSQLWQKESKKSSWKKIYSICCSFMQIVLQQQQQELHQKVCSALNFIMLDSASMRFMFSTYFINRETIKLSFSIDFVIDKSNSLFFQIKYNFLFNIHTFKLYIFLF